MKSKTFMRILFVLKVGAVEELQSAAKTYKRKKAAPSREQLFI
jgi:hypothetical protein|tara:strand:- start:5708 stop:5836 length:129 start_codon:yes stop_codon:yes gene_type:complete